MKQLLRCVVERLKNDVIAFLDIYRLQEIFEKIAKRYVLSSTTSNAVASRVLSKASNRPSEDF